MPFVQINPPRTRQEIEMDDKRPDTRDEAMHEMMRFKRESEDSIEGPITEIIIIIFVFVAFLIVGSVGEYYIDTH